MERSGAAMMEYQADALKADTNVMATTIAVTGMTNRTAPSHVRP